VPEYFSCSKKKLKDTARYTSSTNGSPNGVAPKMRSAHAGVLCRRHGFRRRSTFFLSDANRARFKVGNRDIQTTFLQSACLSWKNGSGTTCPSRRWRWKSHGCAGRDIIVSSSHAFAKGVLTTAEQLHISYVHSPMRYAWDLASPVPGVTTGLDTGIKGHVGALDVSPPAPVGPPDGQQRRPVPWHLSITCGNASGAPTGGRRSVLYPPVRVEKFGPPTGKRMTTTSRCRAWFRTNGWT
jgi:hypothetical protein